MSFAEVQFPTDISYGSAGGAGWQTTVVVLDSGNEKRNQNWSRDRGSWDVSYGIKTPTQARALLAFFQARAGKFQGFRFKDWLDYSVTAENFGTGNNSTVAFQLTKKYTSVNTYTKNITKPVNGTVSIFKDAVLQTVTTHYTINYTTGIVTFTSAPGTNAALTWTGEFDKPARFDTDSIPFAAIDAGIWSATSIPVVELRA